MTADVELLSILRDIGARRRNAVGDYWSLDFCNKAAAEIEALRAEVEEWEASYQLAADAGLAHAERAEQLAEALRDATTMLLVDYPATAKRLRAVITAAQGNDDA